MTYIAIALIATGAILKVTIYEVDAAKLLAPGMCFGKGRTEDAACAEARKWAAWFRSRGV